MAWKRISIGLLLLCGQGTAKKVSVTMRVTYKTFGCKTNQYDTERVRQEVEAKGSLTVEKSDDFDICVVNTCTVTNVADTEARKFIRKVKREKPEARVIVMGCSAVLRSDEYREMSEVESVVEGHDPIQVSLAVRNKQKLTQIEGFRENREGSGTLAGLDILDYRRSPTRWWFKIQDGCDRKFSFCATRLARGSSRSRELEEVVAEAKSLSDHHPEIVLTGIHIGHYGRDLESPIGLPELLDALMERVPKPRFRLGSIEATEIGDSLLDLVNSSRGRIAPHFHMPLQSGADPVLRRMRRWHTREEYRINAIKIADKLPYVGLGADIITGFPGERDKDHQQTVKLVEELPYTYLHVFPFSKKDNTHAAELKDVVPRKLSRERGMELRKLAEDKNVQYRDSRSGGPSLVTLERNGTSAMTEDYLRVGISDSVTRNPDRLYKGILKGEGKELYIDLDD